MKINPLSRDKTKKDMKVLEIRINPTIPNGKKYSDYRGQRFIVTKQIDNFGDRCVAIDQGQPFMFIAASDCEKLNHPIK
jgi:hypothetical protein